MAKKNPKTCVVRLADHLTGGLRLKAAGADQVRTYTAGECVELDWNDSSELVGGGFAKRLEDEEAADATLADGIDGRLGLPPKTPAEPEKGGEGGSQRKGKGGK